MNAQHVLLATLGTALVIAALAVVYLKHESRRSFVEWQDLIAERDALNVEWGQLQLEQSTLATHTRIEHLAHSRLRMAAPAADAVVLLRP